MSQTDPILVRPAAATAFGMRYRPHRDQRQSKGYAVRHGATRPTENSISNRIRLVTAMRLRSAVAGHAPQSGHPQLSCAIEPVFGRKPRGPRRDDICSKLILIPTVAIAAALLLPAFAFAQVPALHRRPSLSPLFRLLKKCQQLKHRSCRHRPRPRRLQSRRPR